MLVSCSLLDRRTHPFLRVTACWTCSFTHLNPFWQLGPLLTAPWCPTSPLASPHWDLLWAPDLSGTVPAWRLTCRLLASPELKPEPIVTVAPAPARATFWARHAPASPGENRLRPSVTRPVQLFPAVPPKHGPTPSLPARSGRLV